MSSKMPFECYSISGTLPLPLIHRKHCLVKSLVVAWVHERQATQKR